MKKPLDRMMHFVIAFLLFVAGASLLQAQTAVQNFESYSIGASISGIGWSPSDNKASVANDPLASGNKVLMDTIGNYNAAPVVKIVLPPGKTLADYGTFTFKGYFAQGDVGYKLIEVEAYQSLPTGHAFKSPDADSIGSWNRAQMGSSAWENISINIANSSSLHDTIYVAFGINCAGTGNVGGTGVPTIWYADNVALVPKVVADPVVQNFEGFSIGDSLKTIGWSTADIQAKIAIDPLVSGNEVLKNTINNYNAAPVVKLVLPPGKTLADYGTFTFNGYFAQGDVGYKTIEVEAYQSSPTGHAFKSPDADSIGSWNRALAGSSAWENISINIANSSSLHDTIYVAFGINCAGTGNVGGTGVPTIWYADNVALVPKVVASYLSWNFESNSIGDSLAHIGWSPSDIQAVVANDPVAGGNKVLKNIVHNYNAAPVLRYILPAGKTLANYGTFAFKGYFAQGDVGYKLIEVEAYQSLPTGHAFKSPDADSIGSWNRALAGSSAWENISINIANSSSLHDTIYVAFGINCAGTGSVGAAGDTTIWYADSVTLVPKSISASNSVFASSRSSVDFGTDTVGIAKKDSVRIYNRGTDPLNVTGISSTNALFTFSPSLFTIAPSDSASLTITFTPVDTSSQSGFIILTNNAVGSPDSISVRGKGVGQSIPVVTNGSFESSSTGVVDTTAVKGWVIQKVTGSATFEIVSDTVEQGNRALKVTVSSLGTNAYDIQAIADSLRVKPGGVYNYSIWAKAALPGAQIDLTLGHYVTYVEYKAIRPANLTTAWHQFTMQFTVNDNQTYIRGPISCSFAGNIGNAIYLDNLQITEVVQNPVDSSKIWKGPALAHGSPKFLGSAGDSPDNNFINYWTQLTPENAGKWGSVGTSTDTTQWNWSGLDNDYNYAQNHGLIFKDHNLIWGNQQPSWISGLDSAHQLSYITTWMRMVGQRYPNIAMIDVVNEPLYGHNPPDGNNGHANYENALGGTGTTGWDWVVNAFKLARKYLPNAKLLINDYGILNSTSNTNAYKGIINILKDSSLIDGIGCQEHGLESTSAATVQSNLDILATTGLPIYISEFDLNIQDDTQQKTKFQELFPVFWQSPSIKGVTLWGYIQGKTWLTNSYLVNTDGTARPALLWLASYIANNPLSVQKNVSDMPTRFQLAQNFPNPFNPTSEIQYSVPRSGHLSLKVYNTLGMEVMTLFDGVRQPGNYSVTFNGSALASGVYFYRLQTSSFTETKKLLLVK